MKTGKIYILKLKSGCFYIGQTCDIQRRWAEHNAKTGAVITKRDPPVAKIFEFDTGHKDKKLVLYIEDMITLVCMNEAGSAKAIGGRYLTTDYRRADKAWIQIELNRIKKAYETNQPISEEIENWIKYAIREVKKNN